MVIRKRPEMNFVKSSFRLILLQSIFLLGICVEGNVETQLFDPGFLEGDCNYHSLTAASDGKLYFSVSTHQEESSARIFQFDPESEKTKQVGDLEDILGTQIDRETPHGKIHSGLIEHEGYLYFATHTSSYDGNLPNLNPKGRSPYPGGHFVRYHLKSGKFEAIAKLQLPNEGIITMKLDKQTETLYGLTWPTGLLISYNLKDKQLRNWGATQERGEWGHLGSEWSFICRKLGIDGQGTLYGSTDRGRVWNLNTSKQRPIYYSTDLDLNSVVPDRDPAFKILPEPHYYWQGWRTILWNEKTNSFWGLHGGSTQLFEYSPSKNSLSSIHSFKADGVSQDSQRNPMRTQLGFMLGPNNTLYYLGHAPGQKVQGRVDLKSSVHLLTYQIDSKSFMDHGPLTLETGRRIFFTESIAMGADGHLYTVAWVETIDPTQGKKIRAARRQAGPAETDEIAYEIQLVQLEKLKL